MAEAGSYVSFSMRILLVRVRKTLFRGSVNNGPGPGDYILFYLRENLGMMDTEFTKNRRSSSGEIFDVFRTLFFNDIVGKKSL